MSPRLAMTWRDPLRYLLQQAASEGLIDAVEVVPSGYLRAGLESVLQLRLAELDLPYSFHFVEHSLGSADYLDNHLHERLATFMAPFSPLFVSEHLTAARSGDLDLEMNLPPIATEAAVEITAENIAAFRDQLAPGQRFLLEHVPTYFRHRASTMDELVFYLAVAEAADADLLIDLHNLHCDEQNQGLDAAAFLRELPAGRVRELHLAGGYELHPGARVDGHDAALPDRVLELLDIALTHHTPELVVIEREHRFDDLPSIHADLARVREVLNG